MLRITRLVVIILCCVIAGRFIYLLIDFNTPEWVEFEREDIFSFSGASFFDRNNIKKVSPFLGLLPSSGGIYDVRVKTVGVEREKVYGLNGSSTGYKERRRDEVVTHKFNFSSGEHATYRFPIWGPLGSATEKRLYMEVKQALQK